MEVQKGGLLTQVVINEYQIIHKILCIIQIILESQVVDCLMCSFYTEILAVNLSAFSYRLFHEEFFPIYEALERILHETVCRKMQIN